MPKRRITTPARRWWQRIIRAAALTVVGLVILYVTLPYWLPDDVVRQYLAGTMSEQMGVGVEVGDVSISWSDGIELCDLTIESPEGFGAGPMVEVGRIRAEFSPIDLFCRKQIAWMVLEEPKVFVQVDEEGNVNLAALGKLKFEADSKRISVRQAEVTIELPGSSRLLKVSVRDVEYVAGQVRKLGSVTVSAALRQEDDAAPMSLRLAAEGSRPAALGEALFNFANVDLSQIPLAKLLGLPLRALSGRCRGSLTVQINHQSIVDQFSLNLRIRNLQVQPNDGPELPVVPEAGFRVSAVFDPVTEDLAAGLIDIRSASVRLPGIDLTGHASLSTHILNGQWEAINSLHLEGNIYPEQLAALLNGRRVMAGELEVTGPLAVKVTVDRTGSVFDLRGAVDAVGAELRRSSQVIKPTGRPLAMDIKATLDRRNWQLRFDRDAIRISLGDNSFTGGGSISDIRRLIAPLPGRVPAWPEILRRLALLDWQGACTIIDPEPLIELVGGFIPLPTPFELDGQVTGNWSVKQSPGPQVQLGLLIPAETRLAVGELFVKDAGGPENPGLPLSLDISAKIDLKGQAIDMLDVDLVVGQGRLSVTNGTVSFPGKSGSGDVLAEGRFDGRRMELLQECWPALRSDSGSGISGGVHGQFRVTLADGMIAAEAVADIAALEIDLGRIATKPAGRPGKLTAGLICHTDGAGRRYQLSLAAESPQASLSAKGEFSRGLGHSAPVKFSLGAKIRDAQWLTETFPLAAEAIAGGRLTGMAEFRATGSWRPGRVVVELSCNADQIEFVSGRQPATTKAAGVPLRLDLAGAVTTSGQLRIFEISRAAARFDRSTLNLSGHAEIDWPKDLPASFPGRFQADLVADVHFSDALTKLVGELAGPAREYKLGGNVVANVHLAGDGQNISILSKIDAGPLVVGPVVVSVRPEPDAPKPLKIGPFAKSAETPATVEIELTIAADLSRLQVNNFRLNIAGTEVLADALVSLAPSSQRWSLPKPAGKVDAHLAVWVKSADSLIAVAPFLAEHTPAGDAFLEFQLSARPDSPPVITSGHFQSERLSGHLNGKDVAIAGQVSFRDVVLRAGQLPLVGRFATDSLELRAGQNACWLIADLANLPDQATGSFHLVGEYIDASDLHQWLTSLGAGAAETRPASETQPVEQGEPPYRLTATETESVLADADQLIDELRRYLSAAQVEGRISIDCFRTFDPAVDQFYKVRQMEVRTSIDRGRILAAYVAGLNGGTIRNSYQVDLGEEAPVVDYTMSMLDVVATENIQPQLAIYFPGNIVEGLFNRTEHSKAALRDMLANMQDYRHQIRPIGVAKTITTTGLLAGRAAPKFVTRIFPGLNLTKYRYNKMTSFAKFRPDGVAENDMVFSGQVYDMYIEGTTDPENIGRYEIGLILLGTPQSAEWNHRYRQGRIPILKLKARIEGGKMHDEVVSYPWPNESLFVIFLKNNIFYRIWLAAKNNPAG